MAKKIEKEDNATQEKKAHGLKSKSKKSLIIGGIFLVLLPIGAGVAFGIIYNQYFIGKTADYSSINTSTLVEDKKTVMKKYEDAKNAGQEYSEALKPHEMVNVAYELYAKYEHSKSITIGRAFAAVVDQSIRASTIRNGDEYLEESLSRSSIVGVAKRTHQKAADPIDFYEGEPINANEAKWPDEHFEYTTDEYTSLFGKTPNSSPIIYIVSKKTIISSETKLEKTADGYVIDLELNPTNSVVNYVKQMKSISNLADYPAFESVHTTFTLDKDLLVKKLVVHEKYYAKTGAVGADIDANLNIYYEVGGDYKIPTLSESINYGDYEL